MNAELFIDGVSRPISDFMLPEMSLSSSRSTMKKHAFVLKFSAELVQEQLRGVYENWVEESREDDDFMGSPQDALAEAGYPPIGEVIQSQELLDLTIGGYLFDELMGFYVGEGTKASYWFDKVTESRTDGGQIVISGICYSYS